MAFHHHEQCPECSALGNDRRGNNLARYTDGSAWCFSCGHWEPSEGFRPSDPKVSKSVPSDLTDALPPENREWLRQCLSDEEIGSHFRYSPSLKRHVFTSGKYWEARSVLGAQPKSISHGDKPYVEFGSRDPIVFAEDIVSAIKVGRVGTGVPLFGNSLPKEWIVRTVRLRQPERVCIWLDSDMVGQSRRLVKQINLLRPGLARSIETELDPKAYSTQEIEEILNG